MISIVWNLTYQCLWNCPFCCIDARSGHKHIEMSAEEKLMVVEKLGHMDCKVDIGGGEIFYDKETCLNILEKLSKAIGVSRLGVSCTGAFIENDMAERLSGMISEIEMSMDALPSYPYCYRPAHFHERAAQSVRILKNYNIYTGIQTVLTQHHTNENVLEALYEWLCLNKVDKWSILKFFPYGRGKQFKYLALSNDEAKRIVNRLQELDTRNNEKEKPLVDFHYLLPGSPKVKQCRCVKKSVGILPDGSVTACFWGFDSEGSVVDDKFYLGDIKKQSFDEILNSDNARFWENYSDNCYLNGLN